MRILVAQKIIMLPIMYVDHLVKYCIVEGTSLGAELHQSAWHRHTLYSASGSLEQYNGTIIILRYLPIYLLQEI